MTLSNFIKLLIFFLVINFYFDSNFPTKPPSDTVNCLFIHQIRCVIFHFYALKFRGFCQDMLYHNVLLRRLCFLNLEV